MNPKKKAKLRAVLYLRQSVAKEDSISLELQEDAGRRYAAEQGYQVVAVESDPGISGRTWNRPAVKRVMTMIEQRQADVIVLWKWSRLSRARLDWAVAIDKVETAGGRIESATEAVDTSTATGRFARGMLAEFAAFESERIGDTWKESQSRRVMSQGMPPNGLPRFGYEYNRDTGYTQHPVTGPVLRECYLKFIRGESFQQIVSYLRDTVDVPTGHRSQTKIWRRGTIIYTMDNPFSAGLIRYKGELYPGAHEPLISMDEWETYQVLRAQRRRTRSREPSAPKSAFTGVMICAHCGKKYHFHSTHPSGDYSLRCSGTTQLGLHTGGYTTESHVDKAFLDWLTAYIPHINQLATEAKSTTAAPATNAEANLRRALIKETSRLDSLTLKFVDNLIPKDSYERLRDDQVAVVEKLEASLREAKVASQAKPRRLDPAMADDWPEMPVQTRRQIVAQLVERIEVGNERRSKIHVVPKWEVWS